MNEQQMQSLLNQLESVHVPAVSWVPAAGWWGLLLLCLALLFAARYWRKRHRQRRWQREARSEVQRLREQLDVQPVAHTLADTSRLARQVLLATRDRQSVAGLHGRDWLEALDELCARPLFADGFGRLLEVGPYQRSPQVKPQDLHSLLDAMDELISAASQQRKRSST